MSSNSLQAVHQSFRHLVVLKGAHTNHVSHGRNSDEGEHKASGLVQEVWTMAHLFSFVKKPTGQKQPLKVSQPSHASGFLAEIL